MSIVIALVILAIAVGAIYLLLRSMGEEGVEVAAPGSCKSGRCGVRRPVEEKEEQVLPEAAAENRRKDAA